MNKAINIMKKALIIVMASITLCMSVISAIPVAKADSSGILGTNNALGSPILNANFTVDNWNKWEMICWGVFLSNFCQPLLDNYESAFKTGAGGSNGAGYKALCFGSGSDLANKDVIEAFCDYAILQQKSAQKTAIYVTYNHYVGSSNKVEITETQNPNEGGNVARPATFNDFFFGGAGLTKAKAGYTSTERLQCFLDADALYKFDKTYTKVDHVKDAYVPTFWIKNASGTYVKILDYNETWDLQMMCAILNAVRADYVGNFETAIEEMKTANSQVYMDVFGNILLNDNDMMLFPAAANPNITTERKINLLNSWTFNSYNSTYSKEQLIEGIAQDMTFADITSGMPALAKSKVGRVALLYYDLDSIMVQKYNNGKTPNLGEAIAELFKVDISRNDNKYPLKFEIGGFDDGYYIGTGGKLDIIRANAVVSARLSNPENPNGETCPEMLHYLIATDGSKVDLFSSTPVIIAPQLDNNGNLNARATREFYNFLYKAYTGNAVEVTSGTGKAALEEVRKGNGILAAATFADFKTEAEQLWPVFTAANSTEFGRSTFIKDALWDVGDRKSITCDSDRLIKIYPVSDVLKCVSSVLGCVDGTETSIYSTMIYMTYLDWYGVINQTSFTTGSERVSEFNPEIYDESHDVLKVDPSSLINLKSEDDMKNEVLHMSYLMLSPEAGREYRKTLIYNGITDFIYEQYNRTVFGGESDNYDGSASKSNSGFLSVESCLDNPLVSWFLQPYATIAVWIIAIGCIVIVIVGLITSKKFSWYVMSLMTVVVVFLVTPSSSELVPYITSRAIQGMFSSKMTAWSIAEGVSNATMEADMLDSASGELSTANGTLEEDEAKLAIKLIKQLNVVYVDRSLMLKQDISQKLTQKLGGIYTDIQTIQSARWVLPMVMQQFTNETDETGSLYVKLSNCMDDASNLYWYYRPTDAANVTRPTATSRQFVGTGGETNAVTAIPDKEGLEKTKEVFPDYVDITWDDDTTTNMNYANYSYTIDAKNELVHTYAWALHDGNRAVLTRKTSLGTNAENYEDADSWEAYITEAETSLVANRDNWKTSKTSDDPSENYVSAGFEQISGTYDRSAASTLTANYSFYKNTESPFYYFFDVVKDTFGPDSSIGSIIGRLQGNIELDADDNKVRANFMYATKTASKEVESKQTFKVTNADEYTPYVRDVLDLQMFFSNVVPYMYQMTLQTGGFDGEHGVLRDTANNTPLKIMDEKSFYEGTNQSWTYRCNWAVKLMENPEYSKPTTIGLADGSRVKITNPMLVESYKAAGRDMVFSEAQMEALGLKQKDLTVVELKCLKVNKEVAKSWTLLINYAGTQGLTKEVIQRQMGLDATMIFSSEFSSGGALNSKYNIYPQSIDLRYLSFDSIMKMLMLNVSRDTSYIYGDTMQTLISDTDIGTAILLLVVTWLCVSIVSLARLFLLAELFFLGILSVFNSIFASNKRKAKIACGTLINNLIFMLYTLAYYAAFSGLMAVVSSDEVLSINKASVKPGNPVWMLLLIGFLSALYIAALAVQFFVVARTWDNMGYELYSQIASAMTGRLGDAISGIGEKFGAFRDSLDGHFMADDGTFSSGSGANNNNASVESKTKNLKGSGTPKSKAQEVVVNQDGKEPVTVAIDSSSEDKETIEGFINNIEADGDKDFGEETTAQDIDAQIEAGKKLG